MYTQRNELINYQFITLLKMQIHYFWLESLGIDASDQVIETLVLQLVLVIIEEL